MTGSRIKQTAQHISLTAFQGKTHSVLERERWVLEKLPVLLCSCVF